MNSTEIVDLFREEVGDAVSPYLWSDALAYGYLNDAQSRFCRFTHGIADARTASVVNVRVRPSVDWVDLDPSILKIRTITRADTGAHVRAVNAEHLEAEGIRFDGTVGALKALVQGLEPHAARCWPVPPSDIRVTGELAAEAALGDTTLTLVDATGVVNGQTATAAGIPEFTTVTDVTGNVVTLSAATTAIIPIATEALFDLTLNLAVFRLPITPITDAGDQALEIDEQHHEALLMWMKYRAYGKQDAEVYDKKKSLDCREDFLAYCRAAKGEQDRARRVGTPVAYGGY